MAPGELTDGLRSLRGYCLWLYARDAWNAIEVCIVGVHHRGVRLKGSSSKESIHKIKPRCPSVYLQGLENSLTPLDLKARKANKWCEQF